MNSDKRHNDSEHESDAPRGLTKCSTGIAGLDEITRGGFPEGRPTLLVGGPGCGKTMLAAQVLSRGALEQGEPGLFVSFEEPPEEITANFASTGFGLTEALASGRLAIRSILSAQQTDAETGEYTLDVLLARLEHWLRELGARRLVLDSIDALFSSFAEGRTLHAEIRRVFHWIRERGLTAVVTARRSGGSLSRFGLEEYASDCVLLLDHRVAQQISKRRIRILKYRGSGHGADEYPFLISSDGISVLPITSVGLNAPAPRERLSTGIRGLDRMLGGEGVYRGSAILLSGVAGTGKSTLAARFAEGICLRGMKSLYLPFEESTNQLVRNMSSVGIALDAAVAQGRLRIEPIRPSEFGLEEHLMRMELLGRHFQPDVIVLDPITSFATVGNSLEIKGMYVRLLHHIKARGITLVMPSLTLGSANDEESSTGVSSLVDVWIIIRFRRTRGLRRRELYVHKARGLEHSEQLAELTFSASGPQVRELFPSDAGGPSAEGGTHG